MIIESGIVRWFGAIAITLCPIIVIVPDLREEIRESILKHEWVHWWQQLLFGVIGAVLGVIVWMMLSWPPQPATVVVMGLGLIEGWVAGQILWRWIYLVGFPIGLPWYWNPCRRYWETAAFRVQGFDDVEIRRKLYEAPYHLRE